METSGPLRPAVVLSLLLAPLFLVAVNAGSAESPRPNTVVATVQTGTLPSGVALDTLNGEVYVTNVGSDTVFAISERNFSVVANISVGWEPVSIAFDPDNGRLYVANMGAGTLSVINGSENRVVATVKVGSSAGPVVYDHENGDIYVANTFSSGPSSAVSVVSTETDKVIANVTAGGSPDGVAYDSRNGDIYVTHGAWEGSPHNVTVISGTTNSVTALIQVGGEGVAFDPDNGNVYVADPGQDLVWVISSSTNKILTEVLDTNRPEALAFDSANGDMYIADWGGTVTAVSGSNESEVAVIEAGINPTNERAPLGIVADPTAGLVFVVSPYSNSMAILYVPLPSATQQWAILLVPVMVVVTVATGVLLSRRLAKNRGNQPVPGHDAAA
jgi:YVTN family beta-propeller protein